MIYSWQNDLFSWQINYFSKFKIFSFFSSLLALVKVQHEVNTPRKFEKSLQMKLNVDPYRCLSIWDLLKQLCDFELSWFFSKRPWWPVILTNGWNSTHSKNRKRTWSKLLLVNIGKDCWSQVSISGREG